jgi:guanylate kinase
VLEKRLRQRKTESEGEIALRLENAKKEMEHAPAYDHVVLNDTLERAAGALRGIVLSYRTRPA